MGNSAGGNLAAAVAQRLTFDPKYKDLPKIETQVLIYASLQMFDLRTPSFQQNGDYNTLVINRAFVAAACSQYMIDKPFLKNPMSLNMHTSARAKVLFQKYLSHDLIPGEFKQKGYEAPSTDFGDEEIYDQIKDILLNPDLAPLMREDLRGLPEAYILTAQYDVLRDDGIMYAKRLEEAGVKATWKHYKKGFHGMFDHKYGFLNSPSGDKAMLDFYEFMNKTS